MAKERILAVDDEEDILELVRFNLVREGYQVICATCGGDTLKIARTEMLDLVENQPLLNRKMVRLDELRTQVKHREQTYSLVRHVSQLAEMYRFRQDRSLEIDDVQGKEMQQRQLRRDIAYVTEIRNGCDRMLELLADCASRFETEINDGEAERDEASPAVS